MSEKHQVDGARLAILSNRLEGIASKMGNTLLKTGRSGVINRAKDFSCCIVSSRCELIAAAESLPAHVLGAELITQSLLELHPVLRKGDAFLHNSPYHGNGHAADHTILVPVIDENGTHHFTVLAKAHLADIGNSIPTTYHAMAKDVYEEGALIFPAVQVQRDYEDIVDIIRMCEMRIRVPETWRGDYLATLGAARIGEREMLALAKEIGWEQLHRFTSDWLEYSASRMSQVISRLPAGNAEATSTHDAFPGTGENGVCIKSVVTIRPADGMIEVDLRDNPDSLPCGLNLTRATAWTAAMIGVFNSIDPTVPKNTGSCSRVKVHLREGCVAGIPVHPTSCSMATVNIADRVTNATQAAFSTLADGIGMAEVGAILPPAVGVVSGYDPRTRKSYVNQIILGASCGPGNPHTDGWQTLICSAAAGMPYHDSIEQDELYHPMRVYQRRYLPDTEGAGRNRGAFSIRVDFGPVGCEMEVGYASDGSANPPKGVRGGGTGGGASFWKIRVDGTTEALPPVMQAKLADGERIVSISCGGGGYGSPLERDLASVRRDVAAAMVSRERAASVYGVVCGADGTIDEKATAKLRSASRPG